MHTTAIMCHSGGVCVAYGDARGLAPAVVARCFSPPQLAGSDRRSSLISAAAAPAAARRPLAPFAARFRRVLDALGSEAAAATAAAAAAAAASWRPSWRPS